MMGGTPVTGELLWDWCLVTRFHNWPSSKMPVFVFAALHWKYLIKKQQHIDCQPFEILSKRGGEYFSVVNDAMRIHKLQTYGKKLNGSKLGLLITKVIIVTITSFSPRAHLNQMESVERFQTRKVKKYTHIKDLFRSWRIVVGRL